MNDFMKLSKCEKTATGEHIWEDLPPGENRYYGGVKLKRWFYKCIACGVIDDRKKTKVK